MKVWSLFRRLRRLFRESPADFYTDSERSGIRKKLDQITDDSELIAYIRRHAATESDAVDAIKRVRNPLRVQLLALDPDLDPFIRIAALNILDASCDDVRIRIARSDHDPAVAIVALQTLSAKHRLREASDAKHDIVRLYACGYCSA